MECDGGGYGRVFAAGQRGQAAGGAVCGTSLVLVYEGRQTAAWHRLKDLAATSNRQHRASRRRAVRAIRRSCMAQQPGMQQDDKRSGRHAGRLPYRFRSTANAASAAEASGIVSDVGAFIPEEKARVSCKCEGVRALIELFVRVQDGCVRAG